MDQSEAVLERLERIEALDRADAEPVEIVAELRALVDEAVAWSRAEGTDAGELAVDELRKALDTAQDRSSHEQTTIAQDS